MKKQIVLLGSLGLFFLFGLYGCSQHMADHPRLILSEEFIDDVSADGSLTNQLSAKVMESAEEMLELENPEYIKKGKRLLEVSRTYLKRVTYLSFAFRLSKDERFLQKAEDLLLKAASFPDWNPSHFLDVAEMTMALSIGYDWLFEDLTSETKLNVEQAILHKGLEPSLDTNYNFWLDVNTNWNQVCNAGMAYGAWAIYEQIPELADSIIQRSARSIILAQDEYKPDGNYPEGPSYWNYGTTFNTLFLDAWGTVYPHQWAPINWGLWKTGEYFLHVHGPTGSFNYSDGHSGFTLAPAAFWFASYRKDASMLFYQGKLLNAIASGEKELGADGSGDRLFPFLLMWLSELDQEVTRPLVLDWTGKGPNPVSLHRTSWADDAVFIGIKGGSPGVNHGHMDAGSFVMDALGVRWALDLGSHDYNKLEQQGIKIWNRNQESQRWLVFRYTNKSHNTLVVDGRLQLVDSDSPILISYSTDSLRGALLDITGPYAASLDTCLRSAVIVNDQFVRISDQLRNNDQASEVRWAMCTYDDIKILGPRHAQIHKDGKAMDFRVVSPSDAEIEFYTTTPDNDFEDENPGTVLIGFTTALSPMEEQLLEVELHPVY